MTGLTRDFVLLLVLTLQVVAFTTGLCPTNCTCSLGARGLRQVMCTQGGMQDPIPINQMDQEAEVIVISGPADRPNTLTIGPIFQQFSRLEELHIVESNVPAIGTHSFWGVHTLRLLNLTRNNITQITDANFRGLVNLGELRLDSNRIESLPSAAFKFLTSLRILTLARNRIEELVPRLFRSINLLEHLDLSCNPLRELNPEVFKDIRNLKSFRCRKCGLSSVNALVYRLLPDLDLLDLRDNEFKYLGAGEFRDLLRLRHLHLDGNHLSVIVDHSFSGHRLESLTLSRNRIAKIPILVFTNVTIKHLDLADNKLTSLDSAALVLLASSLRFLRVSGNHLPLGELHAILHTLPRLHQLHIAAMGLSELPIDFFAASPGLTHLNLSANGLTSVSPQLLAPVSGLQMLDLSKNQLRGLDEAFLDKLDRLRSLKTLYLRDNPWACDLCHIPDLVGWLQTKRTKTGENLLVSEETVRCATPSTLSGQVISALDTNSLGWCGEESASRNVLQDTSQLGLVIACALAVLLLLTVLALVVLHNRHAAHYYTHEENRDGGEAREAIFENPAVLDEHGDLRFCNEKTPVTIATIDDMTMPMQPT